MNLTIENETFDLYNRTKIIQGTATRVRQQQKFQHS